MTGKIIDKSVSWSFILLKNTKSTDVEVDVKYFKCTKLKR